ncbi:ATP-binding domain-containing protein [Nostocoides veronense]|uniref:ATP-binding domain-containing protein n=1 Tax=Nostocoides veronense TaxID=330836 RepID=A0ABN2M4B7_9MICO
MANLVLADAEREYEIDLLVLIPGAGVVVVEVKAGSVAVDDEGRWRQHTAYGEKVIDPVGQVTRAKYAARTYVESDPRWSRGRLRWGHAIVVPHSSFDDDFALPDCPRSLVHDRDDMGDLVARLRDSLAGDRTSPVPTERDCDQIVEILRGRNLPLRDVVALAAEREDRTERLTEEQAMILDVTRLLNRVEIRGGAGSGKTSLALAQVRSLAAGRADRPSQRVALLCYSIGLASLFKRVTQIWRHNHRPAFVGTYEDFARYLGVTDFGDRENISFWENELPATMRELVAELPPGRRFDSIIVDEAQDFADDWWLPLLGALRDQETGGLFVYSDENQRVFPRFGRPPVQLVPLVLDHNLRNTKQIADVFAPLTPIRMRCRGGDGPEVTFVPCSADEAVDVADDQIDPLLDEGWRPEDVALITTGKRHPEQAWRQELDGQDGYWACYWDAAQVFYGHVLGFKGLERRVVVLCVNESATHDRAREKLYVGLSRATDRLIVVGDPAVIREMGGQEVAKRLGL